MTSNLTFKGYGTPGCCVLCGRPLDMKKAVYLEMNQNTATFHEPGTVPPEESQGCFEFGAACARKVLKPKKK